MTGNWMAGYLVLQSRLREARQGRGITQADAGGLIDVCERTYRDFEAGRGDLAAAKVFRLAAALGVHIDVHGSH